MLYCVPQLCARTRVNRYCCFTFIHSATLKSIDYNVAMTFILNNNNNNSLFFAFLCSQCQFVFITIAFLCFILYWMLQVPLCLSSVSLSVNRRRTISITWAVYWYYRCLVGWNIKFSANPPGSNKV